MAMMISPCTGSGLRLPRPRPLGVLVALALVAATGGAAPAAAADQGSGSGWNGYVTAGAGLVPDYLGSDHKKLVPYFQGRIAKGNYYGAFEGNALRFNVLNSPKFHLGPVLEIRRGRKNVHDPAVSRMDHISRSVAAGAFLEYEHVGKDPRYGERVTLSLAEGVGGRKSGFAATLRGVLRRPLKFVDPGLILSVEGDTVYAGGRYMQTYFGITPADSLASGLPEFHARPGFRSIGAAVSLTQFLSRHWSVGVVTHYARLLGDARRSPVTSIAGSPNQLFVALTVGYAL